MNFSNCLTCSYPPSLKKFFHILHSIILSVLLVQIDKFFLPFDFLSLKFNSINEKNTSTTIIRIG